MPSELPRATVRRSIGAMRNPASADAILDAAEALLRDEGLAGFSIEAVARRAKAGKPTIYRWWPSRAHLLLDVYKRQKGPIAQPNTGTLAGDVEAFLTELIAFWRDTPSGTIYRSLLAAAQLDADAMAAVADYAEGRIRNTAEIIERARRRGEVAEGVDSLVAAELMAAYAWKLLLTDSLNRSPAEIGAAARILLGGIAKTERGP